nr:zinc finger X-chromosomal protein-like [Nomia melanderi]
MIALKRKERRGLAMAIVFFQSVILCPELAALFGVKQMCKICERSKVSLQKGTLTIPGISSCVFASVENNIASRWIVADMKEFNGRMFPCPNCPGSFTKKKGLREHLIYQCGQPPRYQCPYCTYCTRLISNVYKHVRRRHFGETVWCIDLKREPKL